MAYLKYLYIGDMYNISIYLSARCILEGLALKRLCHREIVGTVKEELLQKIIVCGARAEEMETAKNKIMYVLLSLIFENKGIFEDALRAIEIIYSDFGCPKAIEGLVRYMPAENEETVCTEEQIYRDWEKYLSEQKHYFTTE